MWYYILNKEEAKTFSGLNSGDAERWLRDYGEDIIFVAMDRYSDEDIRKETAKQVGLCKLSDFESESQIIVEPLGERLSEDKFDVEEIWAVYYEHVD